MHEWLRGSYRGGGLTGEGQESEQRGSQQKQKALGSHGVHGVATRREVDLTGWGDWTP